MWELGAALGGVANAGLGAFSAHEANIRAERMQLRQFAFNEREAFKARDFSARMLRDRHSIEMKSLRDAGLNPMLSVMKGANPPLPAAPAAAGGTAQTHKADYGDMTKGVATALAAKRLKKDLEVADSTIGLNKAAAIAKASETAKNNASSKNLEANTAQLDAVLEAIQAEGRARKKKAGYDEQMMDVREVNKMLQEILGTAGSAMDLANPLRKLPLPGHLKKQMEPKNLDKHLRKHYDWRTKQNPPLP